MPPATLTTLVTGATAAARETAIAAALDADTDAIRATALILEGLPGGASPLDAFTDPLIAQAAPHIARIAPGCLCCTGNLTMRVTLNRILRRPPARLYISLATAGHLDNIRTFLCQPPYDGLLELTQDLHA
ncbi:GTPase [Noviherbaspirillum cavernae]|uniref:GTPase n=1 Tax=Noviherbaspirillum cavernae TaxID=2320862 RepID=A0A418WX94_9BURK|nr:GTPase [Noviherbaspirillum cavernae]RJG04807.1 GTPase [Noviherbaspirillum cavernae]